MKFDVILNVDGINQHVCVQFVKRGETVYVRRCAYTMWNPTPAQQAVRDNLAMAASDHFGDRVIRLNDAVRFAFNDWVKTSEGHNRMEQALEAQYPGDTDAVRKYLRNLRMV